MRVEVGVRGFLPVKKKQEQTNKQTNVFVVSVDVKQRKATLRSQSGRKATELRSFLKEEVDVIGIVRTAFMGAKQQ